MKQYECYHNSCTNVKKVFIVIFYSNKIVKIERNNYGREKTNARI